MSEITYEVFKSRFKNMSNEERLVVSLKTVTESMRICTKCPLTYVDLNLKDVSGATKDIDRWAAWIDRIVNDFCEAEEKADGFGNA